MTRARLAGLGIIGCLSLFSPGAAQPLDTARVVDPYRVRVVTVPSPYWGYVRSPYAGILHGIADLTRANAEYHERIQDAVRKREENRREKLQTRKAELEHIRWERSFRFEMGEEERKRAIKYEEERSRERPPLTEIYAGRSLNIMADILRKETSASPDRPSQKLKKEWVDNINFTATIGDAGLLRQKTLSWPPLLQEARFAKMRDRVETVLEQARKDARAARVSGETVKELIDLMNRVDAAATEEFTGSASIWSPRHHIQALRFTRELKETVKLLENPKEAVVLLGSVPECKTVAELVQHMRDNSLRFAAAPAGSERHYVSLHTALAEEVRQLQR